jgi:putative YphP/YqiW family bacilliredoxin
MAQSMPLDSFSMYPEQILVPMRSELTRVGIEEWRTAADVDAVLSQPQGTVMVVVNSVCGCAARNARPAVAMAMQHPVLPDTNATVFAGQDREATERARGYFAGYAPSSPSIALLKDGDVVFMLERHRIEGRTAADIATDLTAAFDRYCAA